MTGNTKRQYMVVFSEEMAQVPAAILRHLRLCLREIGLACDTIPPTSPFWANMGEGDLILDVGTWRFAYAMDREAKKITVKSCKQLR
jgi:hypothetical protein